jgi:hypothetical protein
MVASPFARERGRVRVCSKNPGVTGPRPLTFILSPLAKGRGKKDRGVNPNIASSFTSCGITCLVDLPKIFFGAYTEKN